ncbi:MAG: hypothetical protein ACR2LF_00500 [Jatrophihabitantaceae bacterium]
MTTRTRFVLSSLATGLLAASVLSGCSQSNAAGPTTTATPRASTSPTQTRPTQSVSSRTSTASPATSRTDPAPAVSRSTLPRGGRTILGTYRIVAYYGGPDGPALGVLGSQAPEQIAATIADRAEEYASFGKKLQPAMELIASVAQGGPGPDGRYSETIPVADVQRYLDVAHEHKMLLILDFQPGRGEFLPQVQYFERFLRDPSVSVALDPEWKMGPGEVPGTVIGSSSASSINAVGRYLAGIVAAQHLPDKLMIVHQFRLLMLPDRDQISQQKGIELVFHADGFGSQSEKLATWHALAFPGRPDGAGFKLFLRQDTDLMTPAQVMALRPQPDVVTYQ